MVPWHKKKKKLGIPAVNNEKDETNFKILNLEGYPISYYSSILTYVFKLIKL